jgi:hypothetical protein
LNTPTWPIVLYVRYSSIATELVRSTRFVLSSVTMKLMPVVWLLGRLRPSVVTLLSAENPIGMVAVAAYPQKSLS